MTVREGAWDQDIGFIRMGDTGKCFYARKSSPRRVENLEGDDGLPPAACSTQMNKQRMWTVALIPH